MLKRFQASSLEDGFDLTIKEIKEIHMDLKQQLHRVEEAILRAGVSTSDNLEVSVTHTDTVTTAVERYVSKSTYKRNGGRRCKGQELNTLDQYEKAEEIKRCSVHNSKRTFNSIIYANYKSSFCTIT